MYKHFIVTRCITLMFLFSLSVPAQQSDCLSDGKTLYKQKKYRETVRVLEKCSDDPSTWELLGLSYFQLGYMDDAKSYLQKALEKDPENLTLKTKYADAFAYNKEFSMAIEEFRKLLEKNPGSIEVKRGLAQALGWGKKYNEAIALYRELAKADPNDYDSRMQIGVLASWNKRFPEAVNEFRAIINSRPPKNVEIDARLKLAEVIAWQKKFDESIHEYENVIAMAPGTVDAYLGKGTVLEWKGQYGNARKLYEKALQIDSQNKTAKAKLEQLMWVK